MTSENHPLIPKLVNGRSSRDTTDPFASDIELIMVAGPDCTVRFVSRNLVSFFSLSKTSSEGLHLCELPISDQLKSVLIAMITATHHSLEPQRASGVAIQLDGAVYMANIEVQALALSAPQAGFAINVRIPRALHQQPQTISVSAEGGQERAHTQLLQIIAHDLREPLNGIINFTGLVRTRFGASLHEDASKYLGYVEKSGIRLKDLLDGLQTYVWLDGQVARHEAVDLLELVEDLCDDLRFTIDQAGAAIRIESLPTVLGNPTLLRLVFQNLFLNAIKFRQSDVGLRITISSLNRDSGWLIGVKDNGIGIPQSHQKRIFDLFFRGHPRDGYEGGGLGLAICNRIIAYHKGFITVESQEGLGSTFWIHIPR